MEFALRDFPEYGYVTTCYAVKEEESDTNSFILSVPDNPDIYSVMPAFYNKRVKKMEGKLSCMRTKEGDFEHFELSVNVLMNDEASSYMPTSWGSVGTPRPCPSACRLLGAFERATAVILILHVFTTVIL